MKRIEREIRDHEIADNCYNCCIVCEKFKTVKDQNKNCEARKARGRIIDRMVYRARKKKEGCKFD